MLHALRHRIGVLLRRRAYSREVDREIRFHLELEAMHAEHAGAEARQASDEAHRRFGNVTYITEEVRRMTGWTLIDALVRDARYAVRALRRSAGFSLVVILTFALGIGATAAVFTVVNGVLLKPLAFAQSEQLVGVWHTAPGIGMASFETSDASYLMYRAENRVFENMAAYEAGAVNLSMGADVEPERITSGWITASLLPTLRVAMLLGRPISEADDRPGAAKVALIGEGLWRRKFGGDPAVLGRTMQVNGVSREIAGVLPSHFRFPEQTTELWLPLALDPAHLDAFSFNYASVARLKPGVTIASATADIDRLFYALPDRYPGFLGRAAFEQAKARAQVHPLRDDVVGDISVVLWLVFGTAVMVLLVGCTNVANLFLVRAESRRREVAVRAALGAGRGDLLRHALTESVTLSLAGGAAGLALASIGVRALVRFGPASLPRLAELRVDWQVVALTGAASIVAGMAFSALPLLRQSSLRLGTSLRGAGRGNTGSRERHRAQHALVIVQVALALVLLAGSALMARSFMALRHVHPGFDASQLLTFRITMPTATYPSDTARAQWLSHLLDRLEELNGVRSVAVSSSLPLMQDGHNNSVEWIEGVAVVPGGMPPVLDLAEVSEGYFKTMGIPLEGRPFDVAQRQRGAGNVIVSRALADHFWKGQNAIGKHVRPRNNMPWYTVIGVAGNVRGAGLERAPQEFVYYPMMPMPGDTNTGLPREMSIAIRTRGDPMALLPTVRREMHALDAGLPLFNVQPMETVVRRSIARTSFTLLLLGLASAIALLLGGIGIYGMISYVVGMRTRELGLRMALGAQRGEVRWMVTRQGITLATIGIAIGLLCSLVVTRLLRSMLFGVEPWDPIALAFSAAILIAVAIAASAIPAWRASRVDPSVALRAE
ncbi:MAG: ABC transporter permease [Gemmatimonadota bacterium]|nr:ABC transporter permease [Gemmatimonadota bacterium]